MTKKEFYECKEGIKLKDVIFNNIIVSEKVKTNRENAFIPSIILDYIGNPLAHIIRRIKTPHRHVKIWVFYFLYPYICVIK